MLELIVEHYSLPRRIVPVFPAGDRLIEPRLLVAGSHENTLHTRIWQLELELSLWRVDHWRVIRAT